MLEERIPSLKTSEAIYHDDRNSTKRDKSKVESNSKQRKTRNQSWIYKRRMMNP